jgi:hypothetical protein
MTKHPVFLGLDFLTCRTFRIKRGTDLKKIRKLVMLINDWREEFQDVVIIPQHCPLRYFSFFPYVELPYFPYFPKIISI